MAKNQPDEQTAAPQVAASTDDDWRIATEELFVAHVRAANAGDRVHIDTVKANGWDDLVVKVGDYQPEA